MSYFRRGYSWEQVQYLSAPTGGWNPDGNPWELPESHAPVLDNALVRPGRVSPRGSLTNWADLSAITVPVAPLNVCGVQPIPGAVKLAIGRKALSATAFVDPWFAPMVRPTAGAALAAPTADLCVALGGVTLTNTATAANLIPGPRGISFEGFRYYVSYGTLTAPVSDAAGTFFAQSTSLVVLSAGTPVALTNAPRGFIDIKGYQSRIWGLGGIDDPGAGTTFNALALFFSNPLAAVGGAAPGNTASFADWKDPVSGLTNKILMDGDTTDPGVGLATVRNGLIIFRQQSIWILRGSTTANYALVPVSRQVGCVDPRSIVEADKGVYFMSTQGLMITDGVTVRNVSGVAMHTLQTAVQVVTAAIVSSFGGYVTCTDTSGGQLLVSMGVASVTTGAPDGHIQPVWCGMFDPDSNSWTRITSALFATDGSIITSGNNYPGWVFSTPDQRLLSIGDKFVTQWEAAAASTSVSSLTAGPQNATAAANVAGSGTVWANPTNAKVPDGSSATTTIPATETQGFGSASQTSSGAVPWTSVPAASGAFDGFTATVSLGIGGNSEFLLSSNYGLTVPGGATIDGIQVDVLARQGAVSNIQEFQVFLMKGLSSVGSNHATSSLSVSTLGHLVHGNATDLWGTTWTPADVNASGFGLAFMTQNTGGAGTNHADVDGVLITVFYHTTASSDVLQTSAYGFAIPAPATITGIQATITRSSSQGLSKDLTVQLAKAGTLSGSNRASASLWPASLGVANYGGSADLWGLTWTPADINNSGFGAGLSAQLTPSTSADNLSVDSIQITVYYTIASVTHQQSFVKVPALYDTDAAGNFQPIPFRWLTRLFPIVGTSTLMRKFGQMKRWFCDYVFQGIGLPSANGFTVKPVDATSSLIPGSVSVQLAPTNNSMTSSSISGGQPNASTSIERQNADIASEVSDLAFDVTWTDTQQSSQPSFVAAELYGIGIEYQPGRDLR